MPITIRSTTGTYLADPTGIFVDEETTIDGSTNTLTIVGKCSINGIVFPLTGSFAMPVPTTQIQYVCLQLAGGGTLTFASDTTGNCLALQPGNTMILYSETIPANAVNDQAFTINSEPVLD